MRVWALSQDTDLSLLFFFFPPVFLLCFKSDSSTHSPFTSTFHVVSGMPVHFKAQGLSKLPVYWPRILHLHFQIRGGKGICTNENYLKHVAKVKSTMVRGMLQFTMNWNVTKGSMWQPSIFSSGFCFYTLWDTLSEKHLCLCISAEEWAPEGVGNLWQWLCIHSSCRWGICLYTLQARLPPHLWHIPHPLFALTREYF